MAARYSAYNDIEQWISYEIEIVSSCLLLSVQSADFRQTIFYL